MYELKYIIDEQDRFDFLAFNGTESPQGKKNMKNFRIRNGLLYAVLIFCLYWLYGLTIKFYIPGICVLVFAVYNLFFTKRIFLRSIRKQLERQIQSGNLTASKECIIRFEDDYYLLKTRFDECKCLYAGIQAIAVTNNGIYLYFDGSIVYIIPMSAFDNEEEKQRIIAFIKEKVNLTPASGRDIEANGVKE